MGRVIPLSRRRGDIAVLVFFWINILFITYIVDIEQIVLPDISGAWDYPLWPPAAAVDLIHWYGNNFDPVLIARPAWWRMTIWIDSLVVRAVLCLRDLRVDEGQELDPHSEHHLGIGDDDERDDHSRRRAHGSACERRARCSCSR